MILTESEVRRYPTQINESQRAVARGSLNKQASVQRTVFLSHSHEDRSLVEPVRILLASQGVVLYVDWKDPEMPAFTSAETARKIKIRIEFANKFVMLASNTSLKSRWVPWELGVGDKTKGLPNVAVLPVKPDYGTWEGNEYVGIYSRIEKADDGQMAVFEPGQSKGIYLKDWLERP